jgi:hypothetical protein
MCVAAVEERRIYNFKVKDEGSGGTRTRGLQELQERSTVGGAPLP